MRASEKQMDMLGLKKIVDGFATANGVRWYSHMMGRVDDSVLRVALDLEGERQEKARKTKKDLEEASGGGDREDWFEEGGRP